MRESIDIDYTPCTGERWNEEANYADAKVQEELDNRLTKAERDLLCGLASAFVIQMGKDIRTGQDANVEAICRRDMRTAGNVIAKIIGGWV